MEPTTPASLNNYAPGPLRRQTSQSLDGPETPTMGKLLIRDAVPEDVRALCLLRDVPQIHRAKLRQAASGAVRFLVAVEAEEIVGFATIFLAHPLDSPPKSHLPKLSDCLVGRAHRSRGVGGALVCAREDIARHAGHEFLYVSIDPVENSKWFESFLRRGYVPLQAVPYRKAETHHAEDGVSKEVMGWRQDLVADLREVLRLAAEKPV